MFRLLVYWLLRRLVGLLARGAGRRARAGVGRAALPDQAALPTGEPATPAPDERPGGAGRGGAVSPSRATLLLAGGSGHAAPLASAVRSPATAAPSRQARQTTAPRGDRCAGGTAGAREPALGLHEDPRGVEEARHRGFRDDDRQPAASRRPRPRPAQARSQLVAVPAGRGIRPARQGRTPE